MLWKNKSIIIKRLMLMVRKPKVAEAKMPDTGYGKGNIFIKISMTIISTERTAAMARIARGSSTARL